MDDPHACQRQFPSLSSAQAAALASAIVGTSWYYLTSCVVFIAVGVGVYLIPSDRAWRGYVGSFAYLDGQSHIAIADRGYLDDRPPSVARFPAYPLLGRVLKQLTGLSAETALVIVANVCLLAAFIALTRYIEARCEHDAPRLTDLALLAMGLWPSTMFFRMAYTASLFLLCALLSMYAMERRWPTPVIALIVGISTATRPVGIALTAVFALYLQQTSRTHRAFGFRSLVWLPLACSGLIAYMAYLQIEFGDALAFAKAHALWSHRPTLWADKWLPLLTLEPIWSPYFPASAAYWRNFESSGNPLISFGFVNPIVFLLTVALVAIGARKKWLNSRELILCVLLLAIPYATMAYDNVMLSQPRFACVIFPVYIVMARLLRPLPTVAIVGWFLGCGILLSIYSTCFAAGYGSRYLIFY